MRSVETLELIVAQLPDIANLRVILPLVVACVHIHSHHSVISHAWLHKRGAWIATEE